MVVQLWHNPPPRWRVRNVRTNTWIEMKWNCTFWVKWTRVIGHLRKLLSIMKGLTFSESWRGRVHRQIIMYNNNTSFNIKLIIVICVDVKVTVTNWGLGNSSLKMLVPKSNLTLIAILIAAHNRELFSIFVINHFALPWIRY